MSDHRWQSAVLPSGIDPQEGNPPDGWQPDKGAAGAWMPVHVAEVSGRMVVLWRRMLRRARRKADLELPLDDNAAAPYPDWIRSEKLPQGVSRDGIAGMVARCLEQITQRPVGNLERRATDGKQLLALWRKLGRPAPEVFGDEMELVARAARECPDPLFAHDVRAEGWKDGRDRSQDVSTLCVQRRWGDRLRVAQEWQQAQADRPPALEVVYNRDDLPRLRR